MKGLVVYEGNWPTSVRKDAKYSVRSESGEYVVGIEYRTTEGERWYPTSGDHRELVKTANEVKVEINGVPGGPFYINEYKHVVVPAGDPVIYYFAGKYESDLIFPFEEYIISGKPYSLDGRQLSPGDMWDGVHQGIPYVLQASGKDIYFDKEIRPKVTKRLTLSSFVGESGAQKTASKIAAIIGFSGGRFYINEHCQLFTGMPYQYIGELTAQDQWFPEPHIDYK